MMREPEPIIVTVHIDTEQQTKTLTVARWPPVIGIDTDFLDLPFLEGVDRDGDRVTFTVENGRAVYAIELRIEHRSYLGRLVSSRLSERRP